MRFYNAIGYHDYEVPTADVSERERIAADLGPHSAMIMRNHGLIACGRTVQDTWNLMYWLESACQVQVDVLGSGADAEHCRRTSSPPRWPSATGPTAPSTSRRWSGPRCCACSIAKTLPTRTELVRRLFRRH